MRQKLIETLENYQSFDDAEKQSVVQTLDLLKNHERCFWRDYIPKGHVTGSAFLLNKTFDKVLLTHHAILDRWLQFGGHADGDENIFNVATRECIEESGIENIKPITTDIFNVDVHPIPKSPKRNEEAHYHHDICFIFYTPEDTPFVISDESNDLKWFSMAEFNALKLEGHFLRMSQKWKTLLKSKAA